MLDKILGFIGTLSIISWCLRVVFELVVYLFNNNKNTEIEVPIIVWLLAVIVSGGWLYYFFFRFKKLK